MIKILFSLSILLASASFAQEIAPLTMDFDDAAQVLQQWTTQGDAPAMAVISTEKAASGNSLAVIDDDPAKHAAWLSKAIDLPASAISAGSVMISWEELYSISAGKIMRFSVIFLGGGVEKSSKHFAVRGESPGWSAGKFSEQRHDIPIPSGATQIKFKLSSAVSKDSDGEFYLDNLKIEE